MKKEAISHGVLDDLANRNDNWEKLDGVPERVDELEESRLILKNEIVNGDFSNGALNWVLTANASVVGDRLYINNPPDFEFCRQSGLWNIPTGNKFYLSVKAEVVSGGYGVWVSNESGQYYTESFSRIGTSTNGVGLNVVGRVGTNAYIDNILLIDLTQTFGAGNEPTKEEMDLLISQIGYIDGEITLTQTQLLNWNLELNRLKANKKQEAWITPTLLNGFTGAIKYRINEFNNLEIIGSLTFTSNISNNNLPAFQLPMSYVPDWFTPGASYNDLRFKFSIPTDSAHVGSARASLSNFNGNFFITNGNNFNQWHINISIPMKAEV